MHVYTVCGEHAVPHTCNMHVVNITVNHTHLECVDGAMPLLTVVGLHHHLWGGGACHTSLT